METCFHRIISKWINVITRCHPVKQFSFRTNFSFLMGKTWLHEALCRIGFIFFMSYAPHLGCPVSSWCLYFSWAYGFAIICNRTDILRSQLLCVHQHLRTPRPPQQLPELPEQLRQDREKAAAPAKHKLNPNYTAWEKCADIRPAITLGGQFLPLPNVKKSSWVNKTLMPIASQKFPSKLEWIKIQL